jgi:hypothetical protein
VNAKSGVPAWTHPGLRIGTNRRADITRRRVEVPERKLVDVLVELVDEVILVRVARVDGADADAGTLGDLVERTVSARSAKAAHAARRICCRLRSASRRSGRPSVEVADLGVMAQSSTMRRNNLRL